MSGEGIEIGRYRSAGQRQARLLELFRSDLFLDIQSLRTALGVSVATVRRDLAELEGRGLIKRTHGGATVLNQVTRDFANAVRLMSLPDEKRRIAEAAAELIVEGDAVMIDSGTTSLRVAQEISRNPSLTFVTNGTDVLAALNAAGARRVHLIGGEYIELNHSLGGPLAAQAVRAFHVDKAILSVSAVDLARMVICTLDPAIACVQQAMIESAQTRIVVADHTKFDRTALSVIGPMSQIDWFVTDAATKPLLANAPAALRRKFIFA